MNNAHADEWGDLLFGAPIMLAPPLSWQLAHTLKKDGSQLSQWRLKIGQPAWLNCTLHVITPDASSDAHTSQLWREKPRVLLSPDGCWPHYLNSEAMQLCLDEGVALAWFDRLDFAHDAPDSKREGAFYTQFPQSSSGCLRVWAWGISLNAQVLRAVLPEVKIGVIGHSRGGKAALLAGALDARIDAVIANNSGTGGVASLAISGADAESLQHMASAFPHWLGELAGEATVQQRLREIDCLPLWSRIAPRPLLILQAEDDHWANPLGTRHAFQALTNHRQQMGAAEDSIALIQRSGGHSMKSGEWRHAAIFMRGSHVGW